MNQTPKTVWITGASSGIGRACAEVYAAKGDRVILSSRRLDALEKVADDLSHRFPHVSKSSFVIAPDLGANTSFSGRKANVPDERYIAS